MPLSSPRSVTHIPIKQFVLLSPQPLTLIATMQVAQSYRGHTCEAGSPPLLQPLPLLQLYFHFAGSLKPWKPPKHMGDPQPSTTTAATQQPLMLWEPCQHSSHPCHRSLTSTAHTMAFIQRVTSIAHGKSFHNHIYFFLKHLSFLNLYCIFVTVPKLQVFLVVSLACTEMALLIVMPYDHYVAICHPLHLLKIPSTVGHSKAFSTCVPHLVVMTVFLGAAAMAYLMPAEDVLSVFDLLVSVF
ncbi:PREDICTED: olfactory receptor 14A16-like, partial [Galeopterus variegatus]|uniref:Olfactory receptor 14A16-like n=1 Tax=Galeopterus variegatus TaxID=482537 RepID=A0ABM0S763_GALVR